MSSEITLDKPADNTDQPAHPGEHTVGQQPRKNFIARIGSTLRAELGMTLLIVLTVAAVATATTLLTLQLRPDQRIGEQSDAALGAAKDGTVALLSYAPDSLDRDFAAAKSHLTGDFLNYYNQFTEQIVAPAARDKAVQTTAAVVRAAVEGLDSGTATVLVFINQTTTSADQPEPSIVASSVRVTLNETDGNWRISSFDPV